MRFPQILVLLACICAPFFSCRETLGKKEGFPHQEKNIPSTEEYQKAKPTQKKGHPIPGGHLPDSMMKKQQKSKDIDTLKPKVA
ncbi:hypothetical protein [Maribacter arenosus]|uniref:Lipoprotein n=1 Tax=Maribacter arenosus TaxID=1854708 RepID=A0ABR7V8X4_9FLAO|nr:hypothetical protein [Maribacter arenosus]MBD0850057.1 hypothetical protein [Maribacter arenosus]